MKIKSIIMLLLTATIWGVSFVAQSAGMEYVGPFTFNAVRCLIGSAVLVPLIFVFGKDDKQKNIRLDNKLLVIGGILCGIALFCAANLQQFGIQYTTVGKAGFITALYIVIVPFLGIFLKKAVKLRIWISVAIAVVGLYFLCIKDGFSISNGDFLVIICAFLFSIHILIIDWFSPKVNGVKLSCIQFFVCGILSSICMFIFEEPEISQILAAWLPILYAGILACGVAYTFQILAQKDVEPTVASMILSLESVVAVLAGWMLLGQELSIREIFGCVLMGGAIILAQLPEKSKKD